MKFYQFKISGIVQGVGFRPFVWREAKDLGLKGSVQNTSEGVLIFCDKKDEVLNILQSPPPLAKVENIEVKEVEVEEVFEDFEIIISDLSESKTAKIPADIAMCDDCVREMLDQENRRFGYFFTSCTNCGPRYSIAKRVPFDRANTALKDFEMCEKCREEYENPADRRFHAQTIACRDCGPRLSLFQNDKIVEGDPVNKVISLLKANEVVSIKGVGGFFLCGLANEKVAEKMRKICRRDKKPFAVMMKDLEMAREFVEISEEESDALESRERPIVLCRKRNVQAQKFLSDNNRLGVFIPYAGIHHLIFAEIEEPLIVTSANVANVPIPVQKDEQNFEFVLDYDREIVNFSDDSIVKVLNGSPRLIRRSRGFVPQETLIPEGWRGFKGDALAVGAEMKNTFCLKKGDRLIVSPHLGNTFYEENFDNFKNTLVEFLDFYGVKPEVVMCDANPNFNVSKFAREFADNRNIECVPVQHHLAHIYSVAMEHGVNDFIGIAADGTGFGDDGKIWGGEVFHGAKRIGKLENQVLIGRDMSNKDPLRVLVGILDRFMSEDEIISFIGEREPEVKIFLQQKKQNLNCIESSSCGRVLDAAAVLLGIAEKNFYEGYCAEMLEATSPALRKLLSQFPIVIEEEDDLLILRTTPLFKFLVDNFEKVSVPELAFFVQEYLANGLFDICKKYNESLPIVFSGGCAYNEIMSEILGKKGV
ncbi:MAG: carbamoyltransferase HypF, partial [Candidatus Peregrinibacteria bacterium]|nr:carbamoyltransferase HypF [Candidatus Peregrinibacteria bacterium]